MYDLIIIGGSAAGLSAAIYSARRKLNFKIITDNIGGEMAMSGEVGNWPGMQKVQGFELAQNFLEHVKSYGVEIDEGWRVEKIVPEKNFYAIVAKNANGEEKKEQTRTVIIATGIHPRKLGIPGEKEFDRKGVTYCTVCDGPLFRKKITATIGAGNGALESALMMTGIAEKVYLITKYPDTKEKNGGFPNGENILIDKVKASPNVEIIHGAVTTEILGDKKVTGLKYKDEKGKEKTLTVDAVMVHAGMLPNSDVAEGIEKDKANQIIINAKCAANLPGIYAAGDVTNIPYKQIAIAVGQGVTAALAAIEYLNRTQISKS